MSFPWKQIRLKKHQKSIFFFEKNQKTFFCEFFFSSLFYTKILTKIVKMFFEFFLTFEKYELSSKFIFDHFWAQNSFECLKRTNATTEIVFFDIRTFWLIPTHTWKKKLNFGIFTQNFFKFWNFRCRYLAENLADRLQISAKNIL